MKKSQTKNCSECLFHSFVSDKLICAKGFKVRFYMPRNDNPHDDKCGFKRKCNEFVNKDIDYLDLTNIYTVLLNEKERILDELFIVNEQIEIAMLNIRTFNLNLVIKTIKQYSKTVQNINPKNNDNE